MDGEHQAMVLWWIMPCFNEEQVLPVTIPQVSTALKKMIAVGLLDESSRIVFVDDGSKDATWNLICEAHEHNPAITGLRLSRNYGHQNALVAGMMTARGQADAVVTMDADLQDDIAAVTEMVKRCREGYDVVYGVRSSRDTDTAFKRGTAQAYYRLLAWLGADVVYNHADFRLLSRRALDALAQFPERNLFLRGMVPMLGLRHTTVSYERHVRAAGETKYPLKKMLLFAWQGITSLSIQPIHCIMVLGLIILFVSFIMMAWSLIQHFSGATIAGWTSMMISVWFIGGIVTVSLGVVGEYVGKTYLEAKRRPRYIIGEWCGLSQAGHME